MEYLLGLGIPLHEIYGQSETCGVTCLSESHKPGTVGKSLPGTHLKLDPTGHVMIRGPHLCLGYLPVST